MVQQTTRFVFTKPNYSAEVLTNLQRWGEKSPLAPCTDESWHLEYMIYGEEIAPTTNTRHLQASLTVR